MTTAAIASLVPSLTATLGRCIDVCEECAAGCAGESGREAAESAAVCRATVCVCRATSEVLRVEPMSYEIVLQQCRAAYEATRTCASQCGHLADGRHDRCVAVCSEARDELKRVLASLDDAVAPAPPADERDLPRVDGGTP